MGKSGWAEAIKQAVFIHLHAFFKKETRIKVAMRSSNLAKVAEANRSILEEEFTKHEIWEIIQSFDGN